jgi:hypothetical protein
MSHRTKPASSGKPESFDLANGEPEGEDFAFGANVQESPPSASQGPPAAESPPTSRPLIPGIDLDSVALEEDYQEATAGDGSPATVVVRKPSGQGYFRAHPVLFRNVRMLEVKNGQDRGFYLVADAAKAFLQSDDNDDVKLLPARLTLCFSRDTGLFLWPLRLPEPRKNNQLDEWSQSALRICKLAEGQ